MDVTPPDKLFQAMSKFVDALCGPNPSTLEVSRAAQETRMKRAMAFDILHGIVAFSMRVGAQRKMHELVVKAQGGHLKPADAQDRSAIDKAKDDAEAGRDKVQMPT